MIKAVLFDLDGTLLPMDQDAFVKAYFGLLAQKLAPRGYEPEQLVKAIWAGTVAMVKNDGSKTNEQAFWDDFCGRFGEKAREDEPVFAEFYANEFQQVQRVCGFAPESAALIDLCRELGLRTALATNPLFPAIATRSRIRWAGLDPADFELYTTYENSSFCKPNPAYYRQVVDSLGLSPEECVMVGNDATEDLAARQLGMEVFLLTPCLINKEGKDICLYPHGDFDALREFLLKLNK